ncbi:MAG: AtpZ/AtpI family protein [Sphingobacteriales bacterium]|nr:AtpZ/AtpI family protein [Sphingobacteriales bacterium]
MEEKKSTKNQKPSLNTYAKYSGLGFQMIVVIALFTFAGHQLDTTQHTQTPFYTAGLGLIGVLVSLYIIIKGLK